MHIASTDVTQWLSCIVGNVGARFKKKRKKNVWNKKDNISMSVVSILIMDSFSKPGTSITHNATQSLCDITGGNCLDYIQLPLEPSKTLFYFYQICRSTPTPVNTPE